MKPQFKVHNVRDHRAGTSDHPFQNTRKSGLWSFRVVFGCLLREPVTQRMPHDEAISHGCSGRGPWVMSKSAAMHIALGVDYLRQQGLVSLEEIWSKFAWKRGTAGCGPACPVV